jgi:hypothetical protein
MEIHDKLRVVTPAALAEAHQRSVAVQGKHGVKYLKYWVDAGSGYMFCLLEAPNKEAAYAARHEAGSILPNEIYEVVEGT